jgi:hypothetical protein
VKKKKEERKLADVDREIEIEITFVCPIRGLVTQKIKGIKYKSLSTSEDTKKYTIGDLLDINQITEDE